MKKIEIENWTNYAPGLKNNDDGCIIRHTFTALADSTWVLTSGRQETIMCNEEMELFLEKCAAKQLSSDRKLYRFYFDGKEMTPTDAIGWKEVKEGI